MFSVPRVLLLLAASHAVLGSDVFDKGLDVGHSALLSSGLSELPFSMDAMEARARLLFSEQVAHEDGRLAVDLEGLIARGAEGLSQLHAAFASGGEEYAAWRVLMYACAAELPEESLSAFHSAAQMQTPGDLSEFGRLLYYVADGVHPLFDRAVERFAGELDPSQVRAALVDYGALLADGETWDEARSLAFPDSVREALVAALTVSSD